MADERNTLFKMKELWAFMVDLFDERRNNIFMARESIPATAGFIKQPWQNYGKVKNQGAEISVKVNETRNQPEFKQFGGFRAVTALHFGRNEEIIQTHVKAIKWLNEQGYSVAGPISEEYIVSPVDINNEEDHITKIIIPITTA